MRCKVVVFDIDGTLADLTHRRHHVAKRPKDWNAFFSKMHLDPPVENVVALCQHFARQGFNIVFCSGRGEEYRDVTEAWLRKHVWHFDIPLRLLMRPAKDSRPDDIIKRELLAQMRAEGHDIWLWVDDRQRVVDAIRAEGITVLQAAPGDFDKGDPYYYDPTPGECLLILMVGPSGAGKSTYIRGMAHWGTLPAGAVLSSDKVREEMLGNFRDQSANDRVFGYIHDTAKTRLRYGLKTVIDATHLHKRDRLAAVALAPEGTTVEYVVIDRPLEQKLRDGGWRLEVVKDGKNLVERHHQSFQSARKDILAGDGLENVHVNDLRTH